MTDVASKYHINFSQPEQGSVHLTHATRAALLEDVSAHLSKKSGFALATLNLDHIVKLQNDTSFKRAYLAHTHVVADGNPIVWLSKRAGQSVELIPGSDLIEPLAEQAARAHAPIALLGSTQDTLDAAAHALQAKFPGLQVALKNAPPYGFDPKSEAATEVLQDIEASGARLCFLALGAPKQEILAARGREIAPSVGFVSIGAGLDFISGQQVRAPRWIRNLALEWLWRMMSDPARLAKRYLECFMILPGLLADAHRQRKVGFQKP